MADSKFDVIVIGSGPGGAATAGLLQKRGLRCLILEKNNLLGGKMISIEKDGYAYDLFPHGQVPMSGSAFEEVFDELGVRDEFVPALEPDDERDIITIAYRRKDWKDYRKVDQGQAMNDPTPFFKLWDCTDEEEEKVFEIMTEMATMEPEQLDELDNISMKDWLAQRDTPSALYNYLAFHANASLAEPIDGVAASEQILIMQQMMVGGGGGQYKGGFGGLTKVMMREFEKNGGTIIKQCRVNKIVVEDGVAKGVETDKGNFEAPVVVSTAGIQPTVLKLVGPEHFDAEYVDYIKGLEPGWGFTSIRYFLDKVVMDKAMYVMYADDSWVDRERMAKVKAGEMPEEIILFMVNHTFYDEDAAPPGKQVLVSGTVCSSDPESAEIQALWDKMDEHMRDHFPEIWEATERREYNGPKEVCNLTRDSVLAGQGGECVGLGQVVGQCGTMKPKCETSVTGLYIAGTDAGARGMGTHQATLSGMGVADLVQQFLKERTNVA